MILKKLLEKIKGKNKLDVQPVIIEDESVVIEEPLKPIPIEPKPVINPQNPIPVNPPIKPKEEVMNKPHTPKKTVKKVSSSKSSSKKSSSKASTKKVSKK